MNTNTISALTFVFFGLLISSAIIFRQHQKVDCEEYQYQLIDTSQIEIILPLPLDSCICNPI